MRLNHEYWCEPDCTRQTNKTATSERLDSWASRLWRGIELVFKSLDCFTVRQYFIFSTRPITRTKRFSFILSYFYFYFFCGGGGGVLSSNAFTIWCCISISRPPRVIRRFKRCSCLTLIPPWISDHMPSKVWGKISYPFPHFNSYTVEVWEWIHNFSPQFTMDVIIYPW